MSIRPHKYIQPNKRNRPNLTKRNNSKHHTYIEKDDSISNSDFNLSVITLK